MIGTAPPFFVASTWWARHPITLSPPVPHLHYRSFKKYCASAEASGLLSSPAEELFAVCERQYKAARAERERRAQFESRITRHAFTGTLIDDAQLEAWRECAKWTWSLSRPHG